MSGRLAKVGADTLRPADAASDFNHTDHSSAELLRRLSVCARGPKTLPFASLLYDKFQ